MASTTGDGAFEANFPDNKLTLFLAQDGGRVLRVTFHDTSSWCHETSWICTLIPDKYSPHINHHKFRQRLSALKEQFATHGRLTSIQFDRWMFVFGHETEDIADDMLGRYTSLKEIILKFIQEFDARVTDIKMKSESMKVDAAAARKDQETVPGGTIDHDVPCKDKHDVHEDTSHSHPHKKEGNVTYTGMTGNSKAEDSLVAGQVNTGNTNINISLYLRESSGKADFQTNWETTNDIPQRPFIDFESLATRLKQMFNAILSRLRMGSTVFCFEHESKEDAINMIIRHAEVKEVILHFLQELDPSIQDIRMKVEFRELCQPEEQTADTSASSDPSLKPLVKGQDSDRQASSDPSQDHSQSKEDPLLSTASHATPSQADRDLFYASKAGNLEKVKGLLTTPGVDVDCRVGWWSQTPVMEAAYMGHRDVVELLLSRGANVSLVDQYGNNILHHACMGGHVETVKYVLSLNVVDINSRGGRSRTPVMEAAHWGHREVVEHLLCRGADVSLVDQYGNNILHHACMGGDVETVKFVLSLDMVDIDARNKWGQTAADMARSKEHQRVAVPSCPAALSDVGVVFV